MKVIITGKRGNQQIGGYLTAEMDDPRHPSKEFVRRAKEELGAHKIYIAINEGPQEPPVWHG
jgi:hypothetical protein